MFEKDKLLTESGSFVVGCNYWASHAGTAMWFDWNAAVVEKDLKALSKAGLQIIRVFPLWPDFQPVSLLRGYSGKPVEFRFGEEPLPEDAAGKAGISKEAMAHFAEFTKIAERNGLQLVVSLLTGWMSGRLFVPPALEGRNVFTDPLAVMWELKFVEYFVKQFKDCPVIAAWDLGNECNCMADVPNRESAWTWTACIVNAIRAVDSGKPIMSGMHGLWPNGKWTAQDQGELTDMLTTHPYPVFTPYCAQDPLNTIRPSLHATAESRLYADIGEKPCIAEEFGTLGPMVADEKITADYTRINLFSLWAHDCHGLLWWCANEQTDLPHAPYDWNMTERELGLLNLNGSPKPVLAELGQFRSFLEKFPFKRLPVHIQEACCIISDMDDQWGVAYSSFILAKQAGFDIQFNYEGQPLKDSPMYLLPCISGHTVTKRRRWLELLDRTRKGATLYISHADGFLSQFEEVTGVKIITREFRTGPVDVSLDKLKGSPVMPMGGPVKLQLAPTRADVLGTEPDNNPVLTCAKYGKGKVYFLTFPLELELANHPGVFHTKNAYPYWLIYKQISQEAVSQRTVLKAQPQVGITEHPMGESKRIIVVINYSPDRIDGDFTIAPGWRLRDLLYGGQPRLKNSSVVVPLNANDAAVFTVKKIKSKGKWFKNPGKKA